MTTSTDAPQQFTPGTSREARTGRTLRSDLIAQVVRSSPHLEEAVFAALDEQRKKEIAARIKELRETSPYTQPALAEELDYTTVRGYQKAEAEGGMEFWRYEKLAKLHNVTVDYILRGDAAMNQDGEADRLRQLEEDMGTVKDTLAQILERLERADATRAGRAADAARQESQRKRGGSQRKPPAKKKKRADG